MDHLTRPIWLFLWFDTFFFSRDDTIVTNFQGDSVFLEGFFCARSFLYMDLESFARWTTWLDRYDSFYGLIHFFFIRDDTIVMNFQGDSVILEGFFCVRLFL